MQKMDKYKARYKMKADIRWLDDPEIYQVTEWMHIATMGTTCR